MEDTQVCTLFWLVLLTSRINIGAAVCTPTANYVEANGKYYRRYEGTDATSAVEAVDRCAEDGAYLALFKTESDFLVARDYNLALGPSDVDLVTASLTYDADITICTTNVDCVSNKPLFAYDGLWMPDGQPTGIWQAASTGLSHWLQIRLKNAHNINSAIVTADSSFEGVEMRVGRFNPEDVTVAGAAITTNVPCGVPLSYPTDVINGNQFSYVCGSHGIYGRFVTFQKLGGASPTWTINEVQLFQRYEADEVLVVDDFDNTVGVLSSGDVDTLHGPEYAIDGSVSLSSSGIWSSVGTPSFPWILLTLLESATIQKVEIFGRLDCCQDRYLDVEVRIGGVNVGSSPPSGQLITDNEVCGSGTLSYTPSEYNRHVYVCNPLRTGKYISVQRTNDDANPTNNFFDINEVYVYKSVDVGLYSPSFAGCANEGCQGVAAWDDDSAFVYEGYMGNLNLPLGDSCVLFDSKGSVAGASCAAALPFLCQYDCNNIQVTTPPPPPPAGYATIPPDEEEPAFSHSVENVIVDSADADLTSTCTDKCQEGCTPGISHCIGRELATVAYLVGPPQFMEGPPYTIPCLCTMSSLGRYPGTFCGPNHVGCRNTDTGTWIDGSNTFMDGYQGNFP